jgi:hypothetical protein
MFRSGARTRSSSRTCFSGSFSRYFWGKVSHQSSLVSFYDRPIVHEPLTILSICHSHSRIDDTVSGRRRLPGTDLLELSLFIVLGEIRPEGVDDLLLEVPARRRSASRPVSKRRLERSACLRKLPKCARRDRTVERAQRRSARTMRLANSRRPCS